MKRFLLIMLTVVMMCAVLPCISFAAETPLENSFRYKNGVPIAEGSSDEVQLMELDAGELRGIDVSSHQGEINWEAVKNSGIDFAIIRCGYGDDLTQYDDFYWKRNADECTRLGIPFGVYLYSYAASIGEAQSEASHVLRLIKGYDLSFPVYLDLEDNKTVGTCSNEFIGQMAEEFCSIVQNAGYNVGIYANLDWWRNRLTSSVFDNNEWQKWVAQYYSSCTYDGEYTMWQYTSSGSVDGISGNVDMNIWYGASNVATASSGEYALFPGGVLQITQGVNGGYSHASTNAIDIVGNNNYTAPFSGTITYIWAECNGVVLQSDSEVYYANGNHGYMSIIFMHDNDISDLWVGKHLNQGDIFYQPGTKGWATGPHVHIAVRSGKDKFLNDYDNGNVFPYDALFLRNGTSVIDGYGYNWRYTQPTPSTSPIPNVSYGIVSNGTYTLKNAQSGYMLNVYGGVDKEGQKVTTWQRDGTNDQKIRIAHQGGGKYLLYAACASNKVLDVYRGPNGGSIDDGDGVDIWSPNDSEAQLFYVAPVGGGKYVFELAAKRGYVISPPDSSSAATNGTQLQLKPYTGAAYQEWYIYNDSGTAQAVDIPVNLGNDFNAVIIHNASKKPLTVDDNDNVSIRKETGATNQIWHFTRDSDGSYKIVSNKNNKALDAANSGKSNGTNVAVYTSNNQSNQRWFIYSKSGMYIIKPKYCGLALDVNGGYVDDGTNMQIWEDNGTNAQLFTIKNPNYTVTFNANGGSTPTSSKTVTTGSTYGDLPTPTRAGYSFAGWFTAASGGTQVKKDTKVTITANQTLYAQWKANNYTVTFNASGGSTPTSSKTVTYNSTYGDLPTPTRAGYSFTGWFTAASGGTQVKKDTKVTITANQTLYAQWKPFTYTVKYNANGGTGATADSVHSYDSEKALTKNGFTKKYYTFTGWNTKPNGSGNSYSDGAQIKNLTAENGGTITLYAQWKRTVSTKTTLKGYGSDTLCDIEIIGAVDPCTVVLAVYKNNKLGATVTQPYSSDNISFKITGDFDCVKVMVWDNLHGMEPLSEAETVIACPHKNIGVVYNIDAREYEQCDSDKYHIAIEHGWKYCQDCGKYFEPVEERVPFSHHFENGKCTECGYIK